MKKVKKDQWKLAASLASDVAKGVFLTVIGLAVTGKISSSEWVVFVLCGAFALLGFALIFAGLGDTNGDSSDGS